MNLFNSGTHTTLLPTAVADYVQATGDEHSNQAFGREEFDRRVLQTQQRMAELERDVLLVRTPESSRKHPCIF